MIAEYNAKDAPVTIPRYPKHDSFGYNATMTYKRDGSGYDPMITEYTAKENTTVVIADVKSNKIWSHGNRQSTDMNDDGTVEAGNDTEIIWMQVTLLLKVLASNNTRNATKNTLKDFLVQIKQSDRNVAFLPWYPLNNNPSAVPIKRPDDVSQVFSSIKNIFY